MAGHRELAGWGMKMCAPAGARHATGQPSAAWQCRTPFPLGTQKAQSVVAKAQMLPWQGVGGQEAVMSALTAHAPMQPLLCHQQQVAALQKRKAAHHSVGLQRQELRLSIYPFCQPCKLVRLRAKRSRQERPKAHLDFNLEPAVLQVTVMHAA